MGRNFPYCVKLFAALLTVLLTGVSANSDSLYHNSARRPEHGSDGPQWHTRAQTDIKLVSGKVVNLDLPSTKYSSGSGQQPNSDIISTQHNNQLNDAILSKDQSLEHETSLHGPGSQGNLTDSYPSKQLSDIHLAVSATEPIHNLTQTSNVRLKSSSFNGLQTRQHSGVEASKLDGDANDNDKDSPNNGGYRRIDDDPNQNDWAKSDHRSFQEMAGRARRSFREMPYLQSLGDSGSDKGRSDGSAEDVRTELQDLSQSLDEGVRFENLIHWLKQMGVSTNYLNRLMQGMPSGALLVTPVQVEMPRQSIDREDRTVAEEEGKEYEDLNFPYPPNHENSVPLTAMLFPPVDYPSGIDDIAGVQKRGGAGGKRRSYHSSRLLSLLRERAQDSRRAPVRSRPRSHRLYSIHDEVVRRQHNRRPVETHRAAPASTCTPEQDGTAPMTCPSHSEICLYDAMICDGHQNCPGGEDETFALCVLRHWTFRWMRHFQGMFVPTSS